ncbi:MAG: glycosyltransferase family 4 protein [Actinomycetales bacterium]|nr:glycosyltransferase family 4 protein [Actinomycetales bacterium]
MTDATPGAPRHVVMAVASGIARDARVRKSALAVAAAGHRVTVLWGDHEGSAVVEGELGPVRTIGLPVPYLLRDERARRIARRRAWRPAWPAYRSRTALRTAGMRLAADSARVEGRGLVARGLLRVRTLVHRVRARAFGVQERAFASLWRRRDRRRLARLDRLDWRRELANVADLEAAFTKWLWRLEPDVLHIHDIHLLGAGVQAARRLAAQGRRVPLVYDAHEYVPGMTGGDVVAEAGYQAMEAELIGAADAVVTVSEPIADALVERYHLPRRPVVVLNTPSAGEPARAPAGVREVAGVAEGVPLLVYSGVLGKLRNIPTVVRALAELDGVHFAAVCVPNAHYPVARALATLAEEVGVADRVHLVDPVDPEQVIDFLRSADVGVHPMVRGLANHEMALPNKLFDYVYAGLPVVVSDVAEMQRFVREWGVGRTFDPDDPAALAAEVRAVLADLPAYRERAASPELRAAFSWERQAANLAALYADIAR